MYAQRASYSCTALVGTNKSGVLRPTSDGYYPVVLGALNVFNSGGAFYSLEHAKALFDESSSFMRRIKDGALRGECGHPRRGPGSSTRDFFARVLDIYEPNISHHIRRVWLEENGMRDDRGLTVVTIMGEVKPCGPMGPALQASLENPSENVCFSIRSFTDDEVVGGILQKKLKTIVTWDWVNEPGISVAKKWRSPALENFEDIGLMRATLAQMVKEQGTADLVSMESNGGLSALSLMRDLGWEDKTPALKMPRSSSW